MDLFRWRILRSPEPISVGQQMLTFNEEGFCLTENLALDTVSRLQAMPELFEYVALNNTAVWERRIKNAKAAVKAASEDALKVERLAIQAGETKRLAELALKELVAERDRFVAALNASETKGDEDKETKGDEDKAPKGRK